MIKEITEFHELGHPNGAIEGWWSIHATDKDEYYLLNQSRNVLCSLNDIEFKEIHDNLYFETEWDCHYAACAYYSQYGLAYPYVEDWANCPTNPEQFEVIDDAQSQKMEFV